MGNQANLPVNPTQREPKSDGPILPAKKSIIATAGQLRLPLPVKAVAGDQLVAQRHRVDANPSLIGERTPIALFGIKHPQEVRWAVLISRMREFRYRIRPRIFKRLRNRRQPKVRYLISCDHPPIGRTNRRDGTRTRTCRSSTWGRIKHASGCAP